MPPVSDALRLHDFPGLKCWLFGAGARGVTPRKRRWSEVRVTVLGKCRAYQHAQCPGFDDVRGKLLACRCDCHAEQEKSLENGLDSARVDPVLVQLTSIGECLRRIEAILIATDAGRRTLKDETPQGLS